METNPYAAPGSSVTDDGAVRIDLWVQSADYSVSDYPRQRRAEAVEIFEAIDWENEHRRQVSLDDQKADWCWPGIGLNHPDGHVLHLCPYLRSQTCWVWLKAALSRRLFGLIPLPDPEREFASLELGLAKKLISSFYDSDPIESVMKHL